MCTEATWVLNGMLPEMSTVEPNSLIARANASAAAGQIAGNMFGRMIRRKVVTGCGAERRRRLLHLACRARISTGCTVRTTNGSVTNSSATTTPARV